MHNSLIQHVKFNNIVKTKGKTIEKLFSLYENNKISKDEFLNKLDRLQDLINKNCENLRELEKEIELREGIDETLFLVIEHLNQIGCYETANELKGKINEGDDDGQVNSNQEQGNFDQDFFIKIKFIKDQLTLYNFKPALDFCKENKGLLPDSGLETKLKINQFINLIERNEYQEGIIYIMNELKKNSGIVKGVLPLLIDKKLVRKMYLVHSDLVKEVYESMLSSYKLSPISRLTKRVEYGMMAFKTQECFKKINPKCPTCCNHLKLREEIPFNRHEQTIILCRGTGEELDDQNQPYAFDNGHVFGNDYIKSKNNIVVCPKTGKASCKYPKVCYFV
jgi:macrophage erythroblast attacher